MIRRPWQAKAAAVIILFFVGLFFGQFGTILETVRGNVERGAQRTDRILSTVTTLQQVDTHALEAQIAALQLKLSAGTATPDQVADLKALVARLRSVQGPSGPSGPQGPPGNSGPPGPAAPEPAPLTTTTSGPGGTTTTTRQSSSSTTTSTRPATTTTTRCVVGVGRLVKVGC